MMWKLLRRNISAWQIGGYALAILVGLVIVGVAVQLYCDLSPALRSDGSPSRRMVIYKPVSTGDTFRGRTPSLSEAELADLAAQPWVADMAPLRPADFNVRAGVALGGRAMTTELFFETLPARFVDVDSARWQFDPARPEVPVVIPRDYLALYNFGFAASGGLPAMSESMLSNIPLTVSIADGEAVLPARIVGYSDWLNTIAVPESFMSWASAEYGRGGDRAPSRVVVECSAPGDPAVAAYLAAHGLRTGGDAGEVDRASHLLRVITGAVAGVGGIITAMALCILLLSLYLLVTKNRRTISGLIMLGYRPGEVARRYIWLVGAINGGVLVLTVVVLALLHPLWAAPIQAMGLPVGTLAPAAGGAAGIVAVVTLVDTVALRRLVARCA